MMIRVGWFLLFGFTVALPGNITIRKIYTNQPLLLGKEGNLSHLIIQEHLREKRLGFPVAPPAPPPEPAYVPQPVAYSYPEPAPTCSSCQNQPPAQPQQQSCQPLYPLPQCYTGSSGFMCCNHELEELMLRSFGELKNSRPDWSSANIDQISTQVQRNAERQFGLQFEVVSGVGDYATKSNFYSDKICKIYWECRYILAYATPLPNVPFSGSVSVASPDPCASPNSPISSYPTPPSYPQSPQNSQPQAPQPSSYATAPAYDEPRPHRFKPSFRIDTTSYDPQNPETNGDSEKPPKDPNFQVPLAVGPEELQAASTQQDLTSFDPESLNKPHEEEKNETSSIGTFETEAQGETSESTTSTYGTQSVSPPQEDNEEVPKRAEGVVLYGPIAPIRKNLNYSWRL